jgi:hypothetical protein
MTMNIIMRTLLVVLAVLFVGTAWAGETIYPTLPGTNVRDYSKPGMVVRESSDGKSVYPTSPGTNIRDYSKPGMVVKESPTGDKSAYPTLPGTNVRDYSKSGWKMEK